MKETFTKKDLWDMAGKGGLVLGAVSIAYVLIRQFLMKDAATKLGAFPTTLVNVALWVGKFAGCIALMKLFMRRFAGSFEGVTHKRIENLGIAIAFTSALVYSAFTLALSKYIVPDMYAEAFDSAMASYGSMMDSNSLEAMEGLKGNMPVISFFTNLIYCFIYGSVLSFILSRNIGEDYTPFNDSNNA